MSARIETAADGLLTIVVNGKLSQPEWAKVQADFGAYVEKHGSARVLVTAENFEGWQRGGDWGDLSFQAKYDQFIERVAIVGDKKWKDLTLMFAAKGFRRFPIEFFQAAELARAKAWLGQGKATTGS